MPRGEEKVAKLKNGNIAHSFDKGPKGAEGTYLGKDKASKACLVAENTVLTFVDPIPLPGPLQPSLIEVRTVYSEGFTRTRHPQ